MVKIIEDKIARLRRTIGHLTTIISCKKTGKFTNHQRKLREKYKKYENTKLHTLKLKYRVNSSTVSTHPWNSSTKRKDSTKNLLIGSFPLIQKQLTATSKVTILQQKNYLRKKIETFWKGIWRKKTTFNYNAKLQKTTDQLLAWILCIKSIQVA